jgi:hypothetical protein
MEEARKKEIITGTCGLFLLLPNANNSKRKAMIGTVGFYTRS